MFRALWMLYGMQTGMIIGAFLEYLGIVEIRMIMQDYARLLFQARQAQDAIYKCLASQRQSISAIKKETIQFEDKSAFNTIETASTERLVSEESPEKKQDMNFKVQ